MYPEWAGTIIGSDSVSSHGHDSAFRAAPPFCQARHPPRRQCCVPRISCTRSFPSPASCCLPSPIPPSLFWRTCLSLQTSWAKVLPLLQTPHHRNKKRSDVLSCVEEDKEGLLLGGSADVGVRRKFLKNHPEVLERFCSDLLPLVVQVYSSTVITQVRSMLKLVCCMLSQIRAKRSSSAGEDAEPDVYHQDGAVCKPRTTGGPAPGCAHFLLCCWPSGCQGWRYPCGRRPPCRAAHGQAARHL